MTGNQRIIVILTGVVMLLMLAFPPFYLDNGERIVNVGYGFILSPPHDVSNVNTPLLLMQWIALAVCGVGGFWLSKKKG